jgi:hypothetical protein
MSQEKIAKKNSDPVCLSVRRQTGQVAMAFEKQGCVPQGMEDAIVTKI